MARTVSVALKAHLAGEVTTLATCWKIICRDGGEFFLTDHDQNIVFDGDTYVSAVGYERSAISASADLSADNATAKGIFDSDTLTIEDLRGGRFDYAQIEINLVNWDDLTMDAVRLPGAILGQVTALPSGTFETELRGLAQRLQQRVGRIYSPLCDADLGDARCKVPIAPDAVARSTAYAAGDFVRVSNGLYADSRRWANVSFECTTAGTTAGSAPAYNYTIGNTTTDGSAMFTARTAWTRSGIVATVTDTSVFTATITEPRAVDDWFNLGLLTWETGANNGRSIEVRDWVSATSTVTLYEAMPNEVAAGDRFRIYPGCNRSGDTTTGHCQTRFANIVNFRGIPFLPGNDYLLQTPNAR